LRRHLGSLVREGGYALYNKRGEKEGNNSTVILRKKDKTQIPKREKGVRALYPKEFDLLLSRNPGLA